MSDERNQTPDSRGPVSPEDKKRESDDHGQEEKKPSGSDGGDSSKDSAGGPKPDGDTGVKSPQAGSGFVDETEVVKKPKKQGLLKKMGNAVKDKAEGKVNDAKESVLQKIKNVVNKIRKAAQTAMAAFKAYTLMNLIQTMMKFMQMMMTMLQNIITGLLNAIMTIVTNIATVVGVSVAVAAVGLAGGAVVAAVFVGVCIFAFVTRDNGYKDDLQDCNTDISYMEVPDGIDPRAWTNSKLAFTFFRSYFLQSGDTEDEALIKCAAILGNWNHESGVDSTGVETVFDEKYGLGAMKRWLETGYIKSTWVTYTTSETCEDCSETCTTLPDGTEDCDEDCDTMHYTVRRYRHTLLEAVWEDGSPAAGIPSVEYEDGIGSGTILETVSGSGGCVPSYSMPADAGEKYGTGTGMLHGPNDFVADNFGDIYQSDYWADYPAINDIGIGLGQWTNGRNTALRDYAEAHSRAWHDLSCQLMYAVSEDSGAATIINWTEMYSGTVSHTTADGVTYGMDYVFQGEPLPEAPAIAKATDWFLANWEGVAGNAITDRVDSAFKWYRIIGEWTEGADFVAGTGISLWDISGSAASLASDRSQSSNITSCSKIKFAGNSTLAEAIVSYAWGPGKPYHNNGTQCWQHLFTTMLPNDPYFRSCDRTVACAVHWTGTDSAFPWGSTKDQLTYLLAKAEAYDLLMETGGGLTSDTSWWELIDIEWTGDVDAYVAQLEPGDILIRNDAIAAPINGGVSGDVGHIVMWVGNETIQRRWPGAAPSYCVVSGSINTNSPHVQGFTYSGSQSNQLQTYYVFRNRGKYCSESGRKDVALTCAGHSNES